MNKRMLASLVALAGTFVALYLTLYKLGYIGTLACSVGSCETVQLSRWATFLGVPVGGWGVAYYLGVLALLIAGLTPRLVDSAGLSKLLVAVTATGVLFSAWLTYLELFVIHAICMWCVISACLATVLFVLCWQDWRETESLGSETVEEIAVRLQGTGYGAGIRNTEEVVVRALREE
ncbi:MAG: vitamin K epoxide reductase family protein [Gemmatimonadaceae bacterium]|nr:vitamin K epoxide reductase family protein [Gemmatimonadaceae bacterium]